MIRILKFFLDQKDPVRFFRRNAILLGIESQPALTFLIACCAAARRFPEQFLYISLLVGACFWLQTLVVLTVHFKNKLWPAKLIFVTVSLFLATGFSLGLNNESVTRYENWFLWEEWFLWSGAAFVAAVSLIRVLKYDFSIHVLQLQNSRSWRRSLIRRLLRPMDPD
jgi:hypothetical protein